MDLRTPDGDKMAAVMAEIDALENLDSIRGYAKTHNVKLSKCKTNDQMKDRLKYNYRKQNGMMKDLKVAELLMRDIHHNDMQRRSELNQLYSEMEGILHGAMQDPRLRTPLETEEVTSGVEYKSTIKRFQKNLGQEHCPIVLAGETSSGKSSLLNLFMEEAVLPAKLLSCTSTACELFYGQNAGQLLTRNANGTEEIQTFPYEEREKYIYKESDRRNAFKHTVRLWVPLPFLQSGVTLVDTPGIGENNEMKQVLLDYVEKNNVYGFIYVIKSDNAGGVAQDRLPQLLGHLTSLKNEFGQLKVDPKTAIFICNRWDMVPEDEKHAVEQDIIKKLKFCWPGFDPSRQLFKMNTEFAFNTLKAGYITDDYAALIDGIQELLPMGLQHKLKMAYWWLDKVMRRLHHPVRVYLNRTKQTDSQVQGKRSQVDLRVSTIQDHCDRFIGDFSEKMKGKINLISFSLVDYLKSRAAEESVKRWIRDDLPEEEYGDSWPITQAKINDVIDARISEVIREWEQQNHLMQKHQRELLEFISSNIRSISEKLEDLEKLIRSTSTTDTASGGSRKDINRTSDLLSKIGSLDLPTDVKDSEFFREMNMLTESFGGLVSSMHQKAAIQNVLDAIFVAPALLVDFQKKRRRQKAADDNSTQYKQDGVKFVRQKATVVLENIQRVEVVKQLVEDQLSGIVSYVDGVKNQTPRLLKANQDLLQDIIKDKRTKGDIVEKYQPLEDRISDLLEKSASFAYDAIKEYDMTWKDLAKARPGSGGIGHRRSRHAVQDTMFASFEIRTLLEDSKKVVTVKNYHLRMRKIDMLLEEENTRTLMKKNQEVIPKLIALMKRESLMPALVFQGELVPARQIYWANTRQAEGPGKEHHFKNCHALIESLGEALSWLHTKRLVHIEISLDSVMVVGLPDRGVKLTSLSEAKSLPLEESELADPARNLVYLPPEVLRGERYTSASDVYSLGILIWEVWHDQPVFGQQRKERLHTFVDITDPCDVIIRGVRHGEYTFWISELVQQCMCSPAESRPSMRDFRKKWDTTMRHLKII